MNIDWNRRASQIAEVHFDEDFSTRWGTEALIAENAFYLFNNCPYRENLTARDRELDIVRCESAKLGIRELGYGEHPSRGSEEGYSFAIIFEGGDSERSQVEEICSQTLFSEVGGTDER